MIPKNLDLISTMVRLNKGCIDIHQTWICLNVSSMSSRHTQPLSAQIFRERESNTAEDITFSIHTDQFITERGNFMIISQGIPRRCC